MPDREGSSIDRVMRTAPVIPVLVIDSLDHAVPVAEALVAGGLPVIEVMLRTACSLDAIRLMTQVEGAIVGAGTVLHERQLDAALQAGASFVVSPGLTEPLARAAIASGTAFLPGVATAGDIMRGLDLGLDRFKFFPALASGGLPALRALNGPFPDVRFCPTGGITPANAAAWLADPAVLCVGGSWVVPKGAPERVRIEASAREAAGLRG